MICQSFRSTGRGGEVALVYCFSVVVYIYVLDKRGEFISLA